MINKKIYLGKIENFHFFYEDLSNYYSTKRIISRYLHQEDEDSVGKIYILENMDEANWPNTNTSNLYRLAYLKFKKLNLFFD